ncbi:uncharacterized protein F5147DRAFT_724780 [Suillus discolor]|uniref:RRM domain-containing protein n=1 Tax=Suillus discolor TaxID=1912936 RepID=A0A9P7EUR0_9AGAM|nr:uncharacterized protein F5147DRAFT_724780 [Suillus discolor]KAG2090378.1 hypothetical protein F5147DRAFT_724780 [Suillus discolor]
MTSTGLIRAPFLRNASTRQQRRSCSFVYSSEILLSHLMYESRDHGAISTIRGSCKCPYTLSRKLKGSVYVTFKQPTSALSAYEVLDKMFFQGRLLYIVPISDRRGRGGKTNVKI